MATIVRLRVRVRMRVGMMVMVSDGGAESGETGGRDRDTMNFFLI